MQQRCCPQIKPQTKDTEKLWWRYFSTRLNGGKTTDLLVSAKIARNCGRTLFYEGRPLCLSLSTPYHPLRPTLETDHYYSLGPQTECTPEGILKSRADLYPAGFPRRFGPICIPPAFLGGVGHYLNCRLSLSNDGPICIPPAFLGGLGRFVSRRLSSAVGPICIPPAFLGGAEVVARSHPSTKLNRKDDEPL
jgi:hypothetical protein